MIGETKRDRRAEQRSAVREEILEAAWEIAREDGLAAMTMRDVAERIGMRAPSLYTHFASKMAIVDAMFGQAWTEYLTVFREIETRLPVAPREAVATIARAFFDFAIADLTRYQLMNQRTLPGFTPSEENYAPAVEVFTRLEAALRTVGLEGPEERDIFTATLGGFVDQQLANDLGGERWRRLMDRAVDMYADYVGLPGPRLADKP